MQCCIALQSMLMVFDNALVVALSTDGSWVGWVGCWLCQGCTLVIALKSRCDSLLPSVKAMTTVKWRLDTPESITQSIRGFACVSRASDNRDDSLNGYLPAGRDKNSLD